VHCSPHGCIWYLSRVSPTLSGDYTAAAAIKSWPCVGEWAFATAGLILWASDLAQKPYASHTRRTIYTHTTRSTDTPSIWQMHWRYVVALCLCDYFLEIDGVTKKSHTDCRKCTHGHGNPPENVGGKHYREGGTWTLEGGAHLEGKTTGSFPVYDSHAISGERRGHAKSRRPHHRPHRLQHCTHTDTARKNTSSGRVESSCYVGCSLVERVRDVWRELYSQRGAPRTHDSAGGTRGASHHRSSLLPSAGASSWSSCAGTAITGMAHGRSDSSRACGS